MTWKKLSIIQNRTIFLQNLRQHWPWLKSHRPYLYVSLIMTGQRAKTQVQQQIESPIPDPKCKKSPDTDTSSVQRNLFSIDCLLLIFVKRTWKWSRQVWRLLRWIWKELDKSVCVVFFISFFLYFGSSIVLYVYLCQSTCSIQRVGLSLSAPTKGMEMRSNNYRIDDALI